MLEQMSGSCRAVLHPDVCVPHCISSPKADISYPGEPLNAVRFWKALGSEEKQESDSFSFQRTGPLNLGSSVIWMCCSHPSRTHAGDAAAGVGWVFTPSEHSQLTARRQKTALTKI